MSSTLSRPRASTRVVAPIPSASQPDVEVALDDESDFRQFVRAIALGFAIGFPAVMALMIVLVQIAAPDFGFWPAAGIGLWVSIWTGMFLGGTITVGLWSKRQHH